MQVDLPTQLIPNPTVRMDEQLISWKLESVVIARYAPL